MVVACPSQKIKVSNGKFQSHLDDAFWLHPVRAIVSGSVDLKHEFCPVPDGSTSATGHVLFH
jgi:hypothetical protein